MEKIHDFAKREYSRHYFRVGNCLCFPSARNVVGNLRAHDPHQNCAVLLGAGQSNQQQVSRRRVATIRSVGVVYVRLSACVCRSVCVLCVHVGTRARARVRMAGRARVRVCACPTERRIRVCVLS